MSFGDRKTIKVLIPSAAESRQFWEEGSTNLIFSNHVVSMPLLDSRCPDTHFNFDISAEAEERVEQLAQDLDFSNSGPMQFR